MTKKSFFGFSISGIKRVHAVVSPPVQMKVDLSATARALFFSLGSRTLGLTGSPSSMWQWQFLLQLRFSFWSRSSSCTTQEPNETSPPCFFQCAPAAILPPVPKSAGPGGRISAAAAAESLQSLITGASEAPAASSVSASYSALSRSSPAAGPCRRWRRRSCRRRYTIKIHCLARTAASAAGRDGRECCLLSLP